MTTKNEFSRSLAERLEASEASSNYPRWEEERVWIKVNEQARQVPGIERSFYGLALIFLLLALSLTADQAKFYKYDDEIKPSQQQFHAPIATTTDQPHAMAFTPIVMKHDGYSAQIRPRGTPTKTKQSQREINVFEPIFPFIARPQSDTLIIAIQWDQGINADVEQDWACIDHRWNKEQSFDLLRPTRDSTYLPHPEIRLRTTKD